jgi:hypothetical protein
VNSSQQWPESVSETEDDNVHPDPQWIFEKESVENLHRPEPEPAPVRRPEAAAKPEARRLPMAPRNFEFGTRLEARAAARAAEAPPANPALLRKTYVIAALAAILAGGGAGFIGSQAGPMLSAMSAPEATSVTSQPDEALADLPKLVTASAQPAAASETVIAKKAVPIATLNVSDAAGEANSQIPLALSAEPAFEGQDLILKISGVPESAYLTAGTKAADNTWELPHAKLPGISLVSTSPREGSFDLTVAGFAPSTGELVTPIKEFKVQIGDGSPTIQPASAPPDTAVLKVSTSPSPQAVILPAAAAGQDAATTAVPASARLLKEGDMRLAAGEVETARRIYEQAYAMGAVAGAMGVARTYDPIVISALGSASSMADQNQAISWYRKALAAGELSAEDAIKRLKTGG